MYAAAAQRQQARQVAAEAPDAAGARAPPARVRRVEYGEGWYPVTPDGRRPGDPAAAVAYYTAPTKAVYQAAAPVRGDDVPAGRPAAVESADETVRQRFLAARAFFASVEVKVVAKADASMAILEPTSLRERVSSLSVWSSSEKRAFRVDCRAWQSPITVAAEIPREGAKPSELATR